MLLMDWFGWVYDTVGAFWPLSAKLHAEVLEVIGNQWEGSNTQPRWFEFDTPATAANYVALAARAHEFCQRCHANNDSGALNMMAGLIKAYEAVNHSHSFSTLRRDIASLHHSVN